ncbi:putative type IX secretion system sortase PorU2 [Pedobacter montanisoli]|uniref:C25 family cysteine peptidase n=1 Tax=Pedobacter montanisoli TaxID=2923277 RepID=A0ABS9ZZU4_9SPHI|nr:C25 family cysteine peptidase [Pedobacter montanisoli]MCJ0743795.1 C25 family cysteine peptidase [Pedobacter montanisoli]
MKYLYALVFIFLSFFCKAQTIYGNEWIQKNQKYIKIKLNQDGVYKITHSQLSSLGFLTGNPNPKNFQIYFRGKEIPVYIEGESDNTFDSNDFIEFYGQKNDGKLDEPLYTPSTLQPNPEVSLFDDFSAYFITIGTVQGKRYQTVTINDNISVPENYMIYTASGNFAETYYPGRFLISALSLSEYIEGEGYLGNSYGLGSSQNRNLNTPFFISIPSFKPFLEYYVAGRSNASSTNPQNFNHHLRLSLNNQTIADTLFRGYEIIRSKIFLNQNLSSGSALTFSSINDLGAESDYQAPAYARITYSRSFDASGLNYLTFKLNTTLDKTLLNFTNTNWNAAWILNPTTAEKYNGTKNGNLFSFKVNNSQNNPLIVYEQGAYLTPALENVSFQNIPTVSSFNYDLLIITNKKLSASASEYASYKTSKGFKPLILITDDIYDQFYYGQHHPLAIKNLLKYLITQSSIKPEYLLLLGKGYELPKDRLADNLVPTMGYPASDSFLSSGLTGNNLAPEIATGRIPATSDNEVRIYLDKLKLYENQPDSIWRKNIINITGGANSGEDLAFSNFLKTHSGISSQEYFGSNTISFYKSVTDPITDNLVGKISNHINEGAAMVTYLGHGSSTNTAVSVGSPSYLNNKNKLLFYLINGCSTGNAFVNGSMAESYIFQPDKGAIGWIGSSSEGIASYLSNFTNLFYQNSFYSNYGKSVAKNLLNASKAYQNPNDEYNRAHLRQYIFIGDPTITFYAPQKPDYEITNKSIGLEGNNINANNNSLKLFVIVKNNGKAIQNNVTVAVTRTLSDNTIINYPIKTFSKLYNTDTLYFDLDNNISNSAGNNKFSVSIDPQNSIDELTKINNKAEFTYYIPSNGINIISPAKFAIVSNQGVSLTVQSNNLTQENLSYIFELDTLSSFNSNWKINSGLINGNALTSWKPQINLENNKVYYWRAKLNDNSNNNNWQSSSFTFIASSEEGWNQGHYQQLDNLTLKNITTSNYQSFNYANIAFPVQVKTRGNNAPKLTERRIRTSVSGGAIAFNGPEFEGISLVALNPQNLLLTFNYPSPLNFKNDNVHGTGQFFFNTNSPLETDSLLSYLNQVPNNYYVIGMSGNNFAPKNLPPAVKAAFQSLGLSLFENLENGEPYAFWGRKNNSFFTSIEKTADYSSAILPSEQLLDFTYDLPTPGNNGYYLSEKIGPSSKWSSVTFNLVKNSNDNLNYTIIGVKSNGDETSLKTNISNDQIDISDISAATYPFLRIQANTTNNIDKKPANLKSWKVLYKGYPDITFDARTVNYFYKNKIEEGDSLKIRIGVSNLENIKSDSVKVSYKLTKADRSVVTGNIVTLKPLIIDDKEKVTFAYPTNGLTGNNIIQFDAEPKDQKDKLPANNFVNYNFEVISDKKEPLVDVLFDNKRIINGEIISPKPQIQISITDENKFLILKDTTVVEVYIKSLKDAAFKRVSFSSNKLNIQNAGSSNNNRISFIYLPELLQDGNYTLKIKSKDVSGNYNTTNDYLINFEVINEQTITNFLPYPNPFTTSMQFVFQVTGKIPDNIKVQIMTVTGKIVREIFKNELGPIYIGNNISTFKWDGTDQFGDRLANGVYFYNVTYENNDKSDVKHKYNSTDKYFKNNFGKIYLMR